MKVIPSTSQRIKDQGTTLFLRLVVAAMGIAAIGLAGLTLPAIYHHWDLEYPDLDYLKYPVLLVLSMAIVPFFAALFQTWKLLSYIDTDKAFSLDSVAALRKIKYSAGIFSTLFIVFLPIVYLVAEIEDAPGMIIIGMVMAGAPFVIAVFATVLEKLLQNAIEIKTENDFTV